MSIELTKAQFLETLENLKKADNLRVYHSEVSRLEVKEPSNRLADNDERGMGRASFYTQIYLDEQQTANILFERSGTYDSHDDAFQVNESKWSVEGVKLIDSDESAEEVFSAFVTNLYLENLHNLENLYFCQGWEGSAAKDVGIDATSDFDEYVLINSYGPDYQFNGELLAETSTRSPSKNDRYEDIYIYQVADGSFVAHIASMTKWKGEENRFEITHVESLEEVGEFLEAHVSQREELSDGHGYSRDNDPYHDMVAEVMEEAQTKLQEREALSV